MKINKGGRGIKAGYSSKVVRVPEPVLPEVERMINRFYLDELEDSNNLSDNGALSPEEALYKAQQILEKNIKSKRSTKDCLTKLLQVIYSDTSLKL